jgi:uncharacterized protein
MDKLFPAGLAGGTAFCNRELERTQLKRNIKNIVHTLVISPRRYGKTSLILETLRTTNTPHAYIQFFNAFRDDIVIKRFLSGFSSLLSQLTPPSRRALQKLGQWITHGKLILRTHGVETEFGLEPIAKDPIDIIQGLLNDLEHLLKNQHKQAIIFLDEFQDIVDSDLSYELQSILRDFIHRTERITFIISGSNRHMLLKMFDDRKKPFYKLFERINLQRIEAEHYEAFLQKLAIVTWKKPLSAETLKSIFRLTEHHAYYFNRLCQKLWALRHLPTASDAQQCWELLAEEEFSSVALELSALTKNQRIVLQTLAKHKATEGPTSLGFLKMVELPHRSVLLAIEALEKTDLIARYEDGYRLLDPMMKHILLL